ncbi:MAM and LDL-receptor class A domain-containing protein 1-like isoform X3 [Mya arenaria]|uniref:MAM and LDL-receptor class A domain-containing protein 1-like isoform X3 n=1 Tax=Mya arenaria TaxID=6604 RepID=UPI0022E4F56E|nr:MAM and LDL-receptor class A domain-containing protein 1-like isoform X3 [Mya arenaria]
MKSYINYLNSLWIVLILNLTKYGEAGHCTFEAGTCDWENVHKFDDFDWSVGDCNRFTRKHTDNKDSCAYIESLLKRWAGHRAMLRLPLNHTSAVVSFRVFINTGAGDLNLFLKTSSFKQLLWSSNELEKNKWVYQSLCIIGIRPPAWLLFEATRGWTQDFHQNKLAVDDIAVDQAYSHLGCVRADIHTTSRFMPRTTIDTNIRTTARFMPRTTIDTNFPEPSANRKSTTNYTPIIIYTSMAAAIFCISTCSFAYCCRRCKTFRKPSTTQQSGQTLSNTDTITNTMFAAQQVQSDETHLGPDGPPPPYSEICFLPSHDGHTMQVRYHTLSKPPSYEYVMSSPRNYNVHI